MRDSIDFNPWLRFFFAVGIWILLAASCRADGPWLADAEQQRLTALWPDVEMPDGLRWYKKTQHTQRIAITNGRFSNLVYTLTQDDDWQNAPPAINPNRISPWKVSGGMHGLTDWRSDVAVSLPVGGKVKFWNEKVPVAGGQMLPKWRWSWPVGTKLVDMLSAGGDVFEVRQRYKRADRWVSEVIWKGGTPPKGYHGAGKACSSCHDRAGEAIQYGITIRGDSTVFSLSPLVPGTLKPDRKNFPIE